jgi:hypothetical protein
MGVLVNDMMRLDMVLRKSGLHGDPNLCGDIHTIKEPDSAVSGLNKLLDIIEEEGMDVAVLCHQDMFFRSGWLDQVRMQLAKLPESWVVAGVIGKDMKGRICGRIHDMRIPLHFSTDHTYPHPASCMDECVIIVNMKKKFRFEDMPGFDLYGTLCCLQAEESGGTAWIIDAFCEHYCMRSFSWYPSEEFAKCFKWIYDRFPNATRVDTTVLGVPEGSEDREIVEELELTYK